jgi:hypothetical protein
MDAVKDAVDPATIAFEKFRKTSLATLNDFNKTDLEKGLEAVQKMGFTPYDTARAEELVRRIEEQKEAKKEMIRMEQEAAKLQAEADREHQALLQEEYKTVMKAYEEHQKDILDLQKQANKLIEEQGTDLERMTKEAQKYADAFKEGNINQAQFEALMGDVNKRFSKAPVEARFAGAAEIGSKEAYSSIIAAQAGTSSVETIMNKQITIMMQTAVEQKNQTKEINNGFKGLKDAGIVLTIARMDGAK